MNPPEVTIVRPADNERIIDELNNRLQRVAVELNKLSGALGAMEVPLTRSLMEISAQISIVRGHLLTTQAYIQSRRRIRPAGAVITQAMQEGEEALSRYSAMLTELRLDIELLHNISAPV